MKTAWVIKKTFKRRQTNQHLLSIFALRESACTVITSFCAFHHSNKRTVLTPCLTFFVPSQQLARALDFVASSQEELDEQAHMDIWARTSRRVRPMERAPTRVPGLPHGGFVIRYPRQTGRQTRPLDLCHCSDKFIVNTEC